MKVLLVAIAMTFLVGFSILTVSTRLFSFGLGENDVASVNGEVISAGEYVRYYGILVDRIRRQLGDKALEDADKALNLKQQALESLIQRDLALKESARVGIEVPDAELRDWIWSAPYFRDGQGRFRSDAYHQYLVQNPDFEEQVRRDLTLQKAQEILSDGLLPTPQEIEEAYRDKHETVDLDYVLFDPSAAAKGVGVTPQEIREYYASHQDDMKRPERRRAEGLYVSVASLLPEVEASDAEVKAAYEANLKSYEHPEEVRARHILLTVAQDASPEEEETVRQRAEGILARLREGGDFGRLARSFSQDPGSAPKGGELGYFRRGQMVGPFDEAAFTASPGVATGPVRTNFGWHLIEVEDHRAAGTSPLEEVAPRIRREVRSGKALRLAHARAAKARGLLDQGKSPEEAARSGVGIETFRPPPFSQESGPSGLPDPGVVVRAAFETPQGKTSEVVDGAEAAYVVRVLEVFPPGLAPLEEVEGNLRRLLVERKAQDEALQRANRLASAGVRRGSLRKAAAGQGVACRETGSFHRGVEEVPGIGASDEIRTLAFHLTPEHPVSPAPIRVGSKYAVIGLRGRKGADPAQFERERGGIALALMEKRRGEAYARWRGFLRVRAKVKINEEILKTAPERYGEGS